MEQNLEEKYKSLLLQQYILGDAIQDEEFRNAVINCILDNVA